MSSATITETPQGLTTSELARELGVDRAPSSLVQIDGARLKRMADHVARQLDLGAVTPVGWDDPLFWNTEGTAEQRSQFFAIGNSINFRFWRLADGNVVPARGVIEGREFRGAMYMWRSLRRSLARVDVPLLEAEFLANLSEADFDAIFADDRGHNPLSVAQAERIANLRDLGRCLLANWDGKFFELVRTSGGSLVEFARRSSRLRAFDDPLYKLTMVNAIQHSGSRVYEFRDDPLPAIDYHLLRQGLRQGLLKPATTLRSRLTKSEPMSAREGHELRRIALVAFVELSAISGASGQVLDNRYWSNRVNCTDQPVCLDETTATRCPFLDACARATQFALPIELTRYY
jgi:hypothetical protein